MLAEIVLILALLLILVGMIMVLLDAFSASFFWGLLVLLVPVIGPIYCFIKWNRDQARNGFAMSLVGIVMAGAGIYGGGVNAIPGLADQEIVKNLPTAKPSDEPLPNEEAAAKIKNEDDEGEYDPILSNNKDQFSAKEIEPLAPKEDKTVRKLSRGKVRKVPLDVADIDLSIGKNIEVVFMDGTKKRGRLIASAEDSISLEEQTSGGMVSFEHKFEKVKSILLLVDPSAAPLPPVVKKQDPATKPKEDVLEPVAPKVETEANLTIEEDPSLEVEAEPTPEVHESVVSPPVQ